MLKLAPNVFSDAWSTGGAPAAVAAVEAYVERARANVFGPDGGVTPEGVPEPLDLVQLVWWDFAAADPLPVLKALQRMATDQLQVGAAGMLSAAHGLGVGAWERGSRSAWVLCVRVCAWGAACPLWLESAACVHSRHARLLFSIDGWWIHACCVLRCVCVQVDEDSGEVSVSEPKKIRGIGLVDFPADRLKAAIQAGVPITCVQVGVGGVGTRDGAGPAWY